MVSFGFLSIVLSLFICYALNISESSDFDYPDTMPPPFGAQGLIFRMLDPFILEHETPIQIRFTSFSGQIMWNCVANYHLTALNANTKQRPRILVNDNTINKFGNSETRMLCITYALSMIFANYFIPQTQSAFNELFDSFGLNRSFSMINKEVLECNVNDIYCLQNIADINGYNPYIMASIIVYEEIELFLKNDGWNDKGLIDSNGDGLCTANCKPYSDTTGYKPKFIKKPNGRYRYRWQPLQEDNKKGFFYHYDHIVPHIGYTVTPKGISSKELESNSAPNPYYNYDIETKLVIDRLRDLATNDTMKTLVEFFDNKFALGAMITNNLEVLLNWNFEEKQLFLVGRTIAEYDAVIQSWREKRKWDLIRPTTLIKRQKNKKITTYGGPYSAVKNIKSQDFESYIRVMPHSEYPSASGCICQSIVEFIKKYSLERHQIDPQNITSITLPRSNSFFPAGSSKIEPGLTPKNDLFITMKDLDDLNNNCAQSRLWGGMHFTASIDGSHDLCHGIGDKAFQYISNLFGENEKINFVNIASDIKSGLMYTRTRGPMYEQIIEPQIEKEIIDFDDFSEALMTQHPGVAVLDYDNDGDLDIFVTNGPKKRHSLFQNQLINTDNYNYNEIKFIDVAKRAGFGDKTAIDHDGSGVCYGDMNNDGYTDLLILGKNMKNLLYMNNGDGTFKYLQNSFKTETAYNSSSCSFGDINNDGFIDVVIANSVDLDDERKVFFSSFGPEPFALMEPNELYVNNGDNTFTDFSHLISSTRFSEDANIPSNEYDGNPALTWSIMMVDVNNDGYIDIIEVNDQLGGGPPQTVARGMNQLWINNGDMSFTNKQFLFFGGWMGIAAGDLNCDGNIDLFLSNFGSYATSVITSNRRRANRPSRWFFGDGNGNFEPHSNDQFNFDYVSPFGWGCAIFDYDNDGDLDILYHGGLEQMTPNSVADNPGIIIENIDGCFNEYVIPQNVFELDPLCVDENGKQIEKCTYHIRRSVRGVAIGDLNNDGFYDIITTSEAVFDINVPGPFKIPQPLNSSFDDTAFMFAGAFKLINDNQQFEYQGYEADFGDLFVELSSGNHNKWVKIQVKGTKNILINGNVNTDGIGALLIFKPNGINTNTKSVTIPIDGGSSHISQHSLEKIFGLKNNDSGDLIIKWPNKNGGYYVNKLNNIHNGEKLILYEIPCNYDTRNHHKRNYNHCITESLKILYQKKLITKQLMVRMCKSSGVHQNKCNCFNRL